MILTKGKVYVATIKLNWLQRMASAGQVNDKFRSLGFANVSSTGEGSMRKVTGTWAQDFQSVEIPEQVINVAEL